MNKWEQWQIDFVVEHYGKIPTKEISEKIGKKEQAIIQYCHRKGISSKRYYSEAEKIYVQKYVGRMSYAEIDKALGRPAGSTKHHCYLNGIQACEVPGRLTLAEVSRLVGRDKETIKGTWVKHGLVIAKVGKHSMINEKHLLKFMQENHRLWDLKTCEGWYFEQYDWFNKRKKEEFDKMVYERWGAVIGKEKQNVS